MNLKLIFLVLVLFFVSFRANAQLGQVATIPITDGELVGSLLVPSGWAKPGPVALIIAGSGPTDRDGNSPGATNNALLFLAQDLEKLGIASLRYDKRGVAQSAIPMTRLEELRFEDYVSDAKAWITKLQNDTRFSEVIVIGHSEGSLVGMLAVMGTNATAFVSISGTSQRFSNLLRRQLANRLPSALAAESDSILQSLEQGRRVPTVSTELYPLYRPAVQNYLISQFPFEPRTELGKLTIPVLVIHGEYDIQIPVSDANELASANPIAKKLVVPRMDHLMKAAPESLEGRLKQYNQPRIPIDETVARTIWQFLRSPGKT